MLFQITTLRALYSCRRAAYFDICSKTGRIFFFGGGGDIFVRNCTNIIIYQGNAVLQVNIKLRAGTLYYNSVAECPLFVCAS